MVKNNSISLPGDEKEHATEKLIHQTFPKKDSLRDGRAVLLRFMQDDDLDRLHAFYTGLPEHIRVYLRVDVTNKEIVKRRMKPCDRCSFYKILAFVDEKVVGEATLNREIHSWKQHLGEIRVIIHPDYQQSGLGKILIRQLYEIASMLKIQILYASIADEQEGAIKILTKLGFNKEIVKRGHIKDIKGRKHDQFIMACNIHELWKHLESLMIEMDTRRGIEHY